MAGIKVSTYAPSDTDPTALMMAIDAMRIGYHAVTITNFTNNSLPAIAAGSKIEVAGALFKFDTEEAIGGSSSDGEVFIKLIPSGTSITAEFTNTAPTWDNAKQGWYGTSGSATHRYIHYAMTKSGGSYSAKYDYCLRNNKTIKFYADGDISISDLSLSGNLSVTGTGTFTGKITPSGGIDMINQIIKLKLIEINDWDMDATTTKEVAHGLNYQKIRFLYGVIRDDLDTGFYNLPYFKTFDGSIDCAITNWDNTNISISRAVGGSFDNTLFNLTPYVRGWITIGYEV